MLDLENKSLRRMKWHALDLEATYSKRLGRHEIIEIGICKLVPPDFVPQKLYHSLVNPPCSLIPAIVEKTGLTQDKLVKAPPIYEVWGAIASLLKDSLVLIYKTIDFSILKKTAESYHLPPIRGIFLDVFKMAKRLCPQEPSYKLAHFRYKLQMSGRSHRALDDALVTGRLFGYLLERLEHFCSGKAITLQELREFLVVPHSCVQNRLF